MFQANVTENLEKESEANDHVTVGSGRWIRYMKSDNDSSRVGLAGPSAGLDTGSWGLGTDSGSTGARCRVLVLGNDTKKSVDYILDK